MECSLSSKWFASVLLHRRFLTHTISFRNQFDCFWALLTLSFSELLASFGLQNSLLWLPICLFLLHLLLLLWAHVLFLRCLVLQSGQNHQFIFEECWVEDNHSSASKTIIDFIKLIHMDTCFEVAKSKTNLAVDIAAN